MGKPMNVAMYPFGMQHAKAGRRPNGRGGQLLSETPPLAAPLIEQIAGDPILDQAYGWLCHQRQDASPHDGVWILRERWPEATRRLQSELLAGRYRCQVTRRVRTDEGVLEIWSAEDALVLKAVALVLGRHLQGVLSQNCYHLAGHGGIKAAVCDVGRAVPNQAFVFRSDASKHPDKTFVGRIDRGFDFLGYRFTAVGLQLAAQTQQRFVERATRLQEQGAAASRIGQYVRHWLPWVRSGGLETLWGGPSSMTSSTERQAVVRR
jgi:hypothetical protein